MFYNTAKGFIGIDRRGRTEMKDAIKFRITIIVAITLVFSILSYNIFEEFLMTGIAGYLKRRIYYERVISKKGLSLHRGMYWRKKE